MRSALFAPKLPDAYKIIGVREGNLSSPAALEVLAAIESLIIPLDKMGNDSRVKRIIENMRAILN